MPRKQKKIIKEEDATVGKTMEEIANALQGLFRCIPSLSKEDIERVRRNPPISFLQKLRIIRRIRKRMKNEKKKKKLLMTCETCSNAVYCGEGSHF